MVKCGFVAKDVLRLCLIIAIQEDVFRHVD